MTIEGRKPHRIVNANTFMAVLFVASVFVIGIKLMNPTPIQISVDGSKVAIDQIQGVFTSFDTILLIISSFVLGISTMYFVIYSLFFDPYEDVEKYAGKEKENIGKSAGELVLEERKNKWGEIINDLNNDERKIYQVILDSDGIINQSELPENAEISKSRISRGLDLLESKGLVERKRRGMGNIVLLK